MKGELMLLPHGAVAEVTGPSSSGRTSAMIRAMAAATARAEFCALVDTHDSFDPACASAAGVDLGRLLWVRCGGNADHALKAADLLVQGGGFGIVALDLGDVPPLTARRISLASWYRLRRGVEHTPTTLLVIEREPNAQSCASMTLRLERDAALWEGALLRGVRVNVDWLRPVQGGRTQFEALCMPA